MSVPIVGTAFDEYVSASSKMTKLRRIAIGVAALLMMVQAVAAQLSDNNSASSGAAAAKTPPTRSSDATGGPDSAALGTAKSVNASGDSKLSQPAPYKADPTLLKSNKELERALKSICRGC